MTQDRTLLLARKSGFFGRWHTWLLSALLLFSGLALNACGGGTGDTASSSDTGEVYIGLTDADGDFLTYAVDVQALKLTRADGAVVDALPVSTRVDFAQYTDMTEFLTAATVPAGVYTRVDMTLDFTNADIRVASGNSALAVTPRDSSGNVLTTIALQVKLDNNKPLVVRPGLPAHLTLDFDLEATNVVDLNTATVTVAPLLLADVDLANPKVHRVRGPLLRVDQAAGEYVVAIRPFHRLIGDFGRLTVKTDNSTQYEIDGVAYLGAAGLTQLDGKPLGTATVALGNFNMVTRSFHATEVYAGSSVAFGTKDVVTGSVIARNGNSLTVRGAALVRADGTLIFNDNVTVTLDASTKVTRQLGYGSLFTTDDISVGSHINAFGTLTGSTLDTTNGLVRIMLSSVTGNVSASNTAQITVNLQTINRRPAAIYNFSGTGSGGADSNPAAYRINTGALSLVSLGTNDPVRVRGFVAAYGQAVTNDFTAQTLIDLSDVPAWMAIGWVLPQPNPFTSLSNQALVTDITGSWLHHLFQRGVATTLTANPTVQPYNDGIGRYAIVVGHQVQLYGSFASFSTSLNNELAAAHKVWGVGARGSWDGTADTLSSRLAVVVMQ